jgi:beta-galactosidase
LVETHEKTCRQTISLNGEWLFALNPENNYLPQDMNDSERSDMIVIPGSWEEQGFGEPSKHHPIGTWKKDREYVGAAWYSKDIFIPEEMSNQVFQLYISGVRWMTKLYINNQLVGEDESLLTDHVYEVTDVIKFGEQNKVVIYVNNEMKYPLQESHIHSYHTATNWGGITGGVRLEAVPRTHIEKIRYSTKIDERAIDFELNYKLDAQVSHLSLDIYDQNGILKQTCKELIDHKSNRMKVLVPFWEDLTLWDDHQPNLYKVKASILDSETTIDQYELSLGIRTIKTEGKNILINDVPKFFRGYVDCCIFPQTGYPSWDKEHYRKQFITVKEYGFNHIRLHGWTPPKPFWEAADEEGMFVQTELPHWSFFYKNRDEEPNQEVHEFLTQELKRVIAELNEHPSFIFLSLGNELISHEGHEALNKLVNLCRRLDPTRLYTDNTGFGHLPAHDREGDYYIPTLNHHPPITTDYAGTPNTFEDYQMITSQSSKPIIGHEHGQFTMYVRPQEEEKYKGVLHPHWLKTTMETLKSKQLLNRVDDYIEASGKLQARAYKENIERARRTDGLAGVQLLDIRDFPGQGHATTGVLDAFWDSKGTISPEEFRSFNDEVVLLMRSFTRTLYAGEKLQVTIDVSNFSTTVFSNDTLTWKLLGDQTVYYTGSMTISEAASGKVSTLGVIELPTPTGKSQTLTLKVQLTNGDQVIKNEWEFWTYQRPILHKKVSRIWSDIPELRSSIFGANYNGKIGMEGFSYKEAKGIELAISDHLSPEFLQFLLDGGKAWIMAREGNQFDEVKTRYLPIFWNYIWFPSQVGTTMGMIIHDHPSLKEYPHDGHSNWNWFHLVDRACAINLDTVPQINPIVEVIDNHNRGKHLTYCFETKIGEGSLFFTSFNLLQQLKRPEVETLLHQNILYLMSDEFSPASKLSVGELLGLFKLQGHW